jgi:hypothetical protein
VAQDHGNMLLRSSTIGAGGGVGGGVGAGGGVGVSACEPDAPGLELKALWMFINTFCGPAACAGVRPCAGPHPQA